MPFTPERFVDWLTKNQHRDKKTGFVYRYHSRSDSHSKAIAIFVLDDLLGALSAGPEHAKGGKVVYGVNQAPMGEHEKRRRSIWRWAWGTSAQSNRSQISRSPKDRSNEC